MKKILVILAIVPALLTTSYSIAQSPQTQTDSSNVSTLQGLVVPVGEKNKYLYDYKVWNIWTNPFGFFYGSFPIGISYSINQNVKLNAEPQGLYTYLSDDPVRGLGITLSGSIFFKKVYDGFYLEPGYRFLWLDQANTNNSGIVNALQLIGGWGWVWDSGFNINLGLGLGYYFGKEFTDNESFDGVAPAGNLQFGYTF